MNSMGNAAKVIALAGTMDGEAREKVNVNLASGKLTFTDIMGIPYESLGKIRSIDLVDNKILKEEN